MVIVKSTGDVPSSFYHIGCSLVHADDSFSIAVLYAKEKPSYQKATTIIIDPRPRSHLLSTMMTWCSGCRNWNGGGSNIRSHAS